MRKRVYIAGPISKGQVDKNIARGIRVGVSLLKAGYAPIIPHLSHFATPANSTIGIKLYEQWLEADFSFISTCSAVLRLPGKSVGADREVAFALDCGIPVFRSMALLKEYLESPSFPA